MVAPQTPLEHSFGNELTDVTNQISDILRSIKNDSSNGADLHLYTDVAGIANVGLGDFENTQFRQYKDVNLTYNTLVNTFVIGETVTGAGGSTGVVVADSGTVLELRNVSGVFVDLEVLSGATATAVVDGKIEKYLVTKLNDVLYKIQWTAL